MQGSDDNDEVNETEEFDDKRYFLGSFCFIGVSGSCVIIFPPLCVRLRISFLAVFSPVIFFPFFVSLGISNEQQRCLVELKCSVKFPCGTVFESLSGQHLRAIVMK